MRRNILIFLFFFLAGCGAVLPFITQDDARRAAQRWPDATVQNLNEGRTLYIARCSGCHSLHLPDEFSHENWKIELDRMQMRAKLSDADKELIFRYLLVNSSKNRDTLHISP